MKIYATRTTAPAVTPISVADAKDQLRLDHADDDALLGQLVAAAASMVEERTGRALITQNWRFDTYGLSQRAPMVLPILPVRSISGVAYLDDAGSSVTVTDDFRLTGDDSRAVVEPKPGLSWPQAGEFRDALQVTVVAGYGDTGAAVPAPLRAAMLYMVDFWFTRSLSLAVDAPEIPPTAALLIDQFRTGWVSG